MKSQKSSSALSFSSLSSSFKGSRGKSLDGRHHLNKDLEGDYAIVERDGRVSFDGGKLSFLRPILNFPDFLFDYSAHAPRGPTAR